MTSLLRPFLLVLLSLTWAPALVGQQLDLGLPDLPPLRADSPRDSLLFVDRMPVGQDNSGYPPTEAVISNGFLSAAMTGTGLPEVFKYQIPDGYSALGAPHPMVIAYHGFGASALSVSNQSTLDEECNARNWIYMAPTGIDDKLFGSPISQQSTMAAVQWMTTSFNVDLDRIYIVGFSMGGGVAASLAARNRDPDGIMFAALGMVCSTYDWVQEYNEGFPSLHDWMANPYNFGGSPVDDLFAYLRVSAGHFAEGSYPPYPGTLLSHESMYTNLNDVPTYITYDTQDTLVRIPLVNAALNLTLAAAGHDVAVNVKTGTLNPSDGTPAPHSWAVLEETELFDFFDGVSVDRHPSAFAAQLDDAGPVAWVQSEQIFPEVFTYIDGEANDAAGTLQVLNVENAESVVVDGALAGLTAMPRVTATSADNRGFTLTLGGMASNPSYLLDVASGLIVPSVDSDPAAGTLSVKVPAMGSMEFDVVHEPVWSASFTSSPNPAPLGGSAQVDLDGPTGAVGSWIIVAISEQLLTVKGVKIGALPEPPALLLFIPLDASGDVSFPALIPSDPLLSGLRLPTQAVLTDVQNTPVAVTNLWGFKLE